MKIRAVGNLEFAYLNGSLEGWLVYSPKVITHVGTIVNASVIVILEIVHLLKNLFVTGHIHMNIVGLEFPLVLEGPQFDIELPRAMLGETQTKEHELELLECSADIGGLVKLIDEGFCRGPGHLCFELSVANG